MSQHSEISLEDAFDEGEQEALDPVNARILQEGGEAITSLDSFWLHQHCEICQHAFHRDEAVLLIRDAEAVHGFRVRHLASALFCRPRDEAEVLWQPSREELDFYQGLEETWPVELDRTIYPHCAKKVETSLLVSGDPLLRWDEGFPRRTCAVCGNTLRPLERVIVCPCRWVNPAKSRADCRIVVHRDPLNGLYCWDDWLTGGELLYCPATFRKIGV